MRLLPPEESRPILDEAPGVGQERGEDEVTLSSRVTGLTPSPLEQATGDADSPPPVAQEKRRAHVPGMDELLVELDMTRAMLSIKKSDPVPGPAPSNPDVPSPPTAERSLPLHNYEFPHDESERRESLRAVKRGVVVTVAMESASTVSPY